MNTLRALSRFFVPLSLSLALAGCGGGGSSQSPPPGAPGAALAPTGLNFGNQNIGQTSAAQTVTLTNSGNATLSITSTTITGTNASDFAQTNTCGSSVAAGGSCTLSVTLTPSLPGTESSTVSITDNAAGSPQTVSLTGIGTWRAVQFSTHSLIFGNQSVGTTSSAQTATLSNPGTAALTISSITVTGTNSGDYAQTNNCGASVAAGGSCTLSVTFTPAASGTRTASVSLSDNAADSPQTVSLTGIGGFGEGPELLYSAPATALLNQFVTAIINPNTGAFSSVSDTAVPVLSSGGMVVVDAQFLYISSPVSGQILGYSLNQTTGALTLIAGSPFSLGSGASPQGLATAPNSHFLYAADVGGIDAFTVDSVTGVPTAVPGSPFGSGSNQQVVVDPSGKFLYASDFNPPGSIFAFTIDSAGALSPVSGSPFVIRGQTSANSQPYGVVDTGRFVYAGLTATNQIAAFSIDSETGALTPVPGSPFSAGNYPAVLALANNFLYAVNETDANISGYSIDPTSGVLTPVPGSPFTSGSAMIAADLSGKYLYVSTFDGLQGYNIDPATGTLTQGAGAVEGIDGSQWLTVVQLPASLRP